ncbi:MAG: class I SAM-dependent methyltransferase [Haloarculaceae archaeon]
MTEGGSGYEGKTAPLYAARTSSMDREDVDYYRDRASGVDGPVLEMACGTGRIHLDLLEAGVDIDGFDAAASTLDVLRGRATERGLEPTVWQADMADFAVDRAYDLVICPFNAVQHLLAIDAQLSMLRSVHEALAPGGAFVFDVFVPGFDVICERYGEWQTETITVRDEDHEYRHRTEVENEVDQVIHVENEVRLEGDLVHGWDHRLTMLPRREAELLVRLSPFEDWTVTGDFGDKGIADGDSAQVWQLRK